jgi:hypothetical protein
MSCSKYLFKLQFRRKGMNPEITQFDIIQSKLLHVQQFIKQKNTLMLIYVITILNIALINFIMIVNI